MNRILPSNEILVNFTSLCLAITLNILSYTTLMFVAYKIELPLASQSGKEFIRVYRYIGTLSRMTCSPDQGRGFIYRLVLTHSLQLLRTTNLFLQAGLAEVKTAFLLVLSSKLNSSAKTEVSLFITEVPPPTIPPSRIDCCLTVRFFAYPALSELGKSFKQNID
ncbi:hypothetical protein [Lactobacillus delbrueckii]|uniref:hypothetical protein n=1 Tax=Lactobacillus delbrueckii TaxID=1584 RepID=UPI001E3A5CFA|nr:hypothetical protein [Lactobacillus delbrueckii]MCD5441014.1 hypothetical protein [Lactobacillus delbrueckii subsp. lactis]MCD5484776.1 hypothetical protein [Lactobacillus delbrueckii subsp. lactis]